MYRPLDRVLPQTRHELVQEEDEPDSASRVKERWSQSTQRFVVQGPPTDRRCCQLPAQGARALRPLRGIPMDAATPNGAGREAPYQSIREHL